MPDDLDRISTALADRYTLERELGRGAMATVHLAHDLKHDRPVALKLLRSEFGMDLGADRFHREIKLVASLTHPHILPLFDSGEADGCLYFVMPAMEGDTLRDRLEREERLSVDEAVQIAREVADALDYAHKRDIIHRDIKPENIMLHGGHAVVADFGIGKAIATAEDTATITQAGLTVGTPAYMSPEQAAGEREIDGRSDLYSLGCVLYEMLTGEPPFTGPTVQSVLARRITEPAPDVTASRAAVPSSVGRTVAKLLATTPSDRFDTGEQFREAIAQALLESTSGAVADPTQESIAVLPFQSLSSDPDDEFFADGVTEEILNALAHIPKLRVAGRSSAFSFKGRNEDLRSVGDKLNVKTILEGTIRRSGSRLRVTAQLINVADGYQLWSERYDRVLEDVFDLQDEIANAIADRLRVSLSAGEERVGVRPHTEHLEAYELYLKGRAILYQRGPSIPKALECFKQAVALDPKYAQAWAGLADGYTTSGYSGFALPHEVMPQALDAARRALDLDPELAEAHNALACSSMLYERDFVLAEASFERALQLNPQYLQALAWYGLFYQQWIAKRDVAASETLTRLYQMDPLSSYANAIMAFAAFVGIRVAEAVRYGRRAVELDPDSFLAHWSLLVSLQANQQYEQAVEVAERALAMSGRHSWALTTVGTIYAQWGKNDEARTVYEEIVARSAREYVQPSMLVAIACAVGELEDAINYAQQAMDLRDPLFVLMVPVWPDYDPVRDDPRFQEIVKQLNYPG